MSENNHGPHLPPPAFPPGIRRHTPHTSGIVSFDQSGDADASIGPSDPFDGVPLISPDDPLPPRSGAAHDPMAGAMISPDEPLPPRRAHDDSAFAFSEDHMPGGIATGLNDDPHLHAPSVVRLGDPHVAPLLDAITRLTDALKAKGEAGLRSTPQMTAFEATLRAYCVGYLAAQRDKEGPVSPYDPQGS